MVFWPVVTVIGFLFLTVLVMMMGIRSTARWEQEKLSAGAPRTRHEARRTVRPVAARARQTAGATAVATAVL